MLKGRSGERGQKKKMNTIKQLHSLLTLPVLFNATQTLKQTQSLYLSLQHVPGSIANHTRLSRQSKTLNPSSVWRGKACVVTSATTLPTARDSKWNEYRGSQECTSDTKQKYRYKTLTILTRSKLRAKKWMTEIKQVWNRTPSDTEVLIVITKRN